MSEVENGNDRQLELRDYFKVLARRLLLVGGTTLACVALTLMLSLLQDPVYEAAAEFELPTVTAPELPNGASDVATAVVRLQSDEIAERVRAIVGAAPGVIPVPLDETQIIQVRVESGDPKLAARAANTYATEFLADRKEKALARVDETLSIVQPRLVEAKQRHTEIYKLILDAPILQRDVLRQKYSLELADLEQTIGDDNAQARVLHAKRAEIERS